jgi:hypothetical protein
MSDFGEHRRPIGRKNHRCEWCGEGIPKGERHVHYSGRWANTWQDWRMHNECFEYSDQHDALAEGFEPFANERPVLARREKEGA